MRIASIACLLLCFASVEVGYGQSLEKSTTNVFSIPRHSPTTIQLQYHKFLLLRDKDKIIAIHTMPDPRHGWDGVNYRWYVLQDNSDDFFTPSPERSDSSGNPHVTTGAGNTNENNGGSGWIEVAGHRLEWSKANVEKGWVYLYDVDESLEVYPTQFDRLQDCSGKLDSTLWKSVKQLKAEYKKRPVDLVELKPGQAIIDGHVVQLKTGQQQR